MARASPLARRRPASSQAVAPRRPTRGRRTNTTNGVGSSGGSLIDARVDTTLNYLHTNYPQTQELAANSAGMLVMPVSGYIGSKAGGFKAGWFGLVEMPDPFGKSEALNFWAEADPIR